MVAQGWASKAVLQKINGFLAFAFQFRRELFCLQHRIYNYVSGMHAAKSVRLPGFVVDELRSLSLHLAFAQWNMRRRLGASILAIDATPASGGAVRAEAPERLVEELWRRSEIRGAPVRLDRAEVDFGKEIPAEASQFASTCAECLPWAEVARYTFRETSHINLQEARTPVHGKCSPQGRHTPVANLEETAAKEEAESVMDDRHSWTRFQPRATPMTHPPGSGLRQQPSRNVVELQRRGATLCKSVYTNQRVIEANLNLATARTSKPFYKSCLRDRLALPGSLGGRSQHA